MRPERQFGLQRDRMSARVIRQEERRDNRNRTESRIESAAILGSPRDNLRGSRSSLLDPGPRRIPSPSSIERELMPSRRLLSCAGMIRIRFEGSFSARRADQPGFYARRVGRSTGIPAGL
jgi:hypothetical protein